MPRKTTKQNLYKFVENILVQNYKLKKKNNKKTQPPYKNIVMAVFHRKVLGKTTKTFRHFLIKFVISCWFS